MKIRWVVKKRKVILSFNFIFCLPRQLNFVLEVEPKISDWVKNIKVVEISAQGRVIVRKEGNLLVLNCFTLTLQNQFSFRN